MAISEKKSVSFYLSSRARYIKPIITPATSPIPTQIDQPANMNPPCCGAVLPGAITGPYVRVVFKVELTATVTVDADWSMPTRTAAAMAAKQEGRRKLNTTLLESMTPYLLMTLRNLSWLKAQTNPMMLPMVMAPPGLKFESEEEE